MLWGVKKGNLTAAVFIFCNAKCDFLLSWQICVSCILIPLNYYFIQQYSLSPSATVALFVGVITNLD
jgi:hypothetical protein